MGVHAGYVAKRETDFWAQRIAPLLRGKGWKPARLAEAAGLSPSTLSRWRHGPLKNLPDTTQLERAAKAFGVSVDQLLGSKPITDYPRFVSGALTKDEYEVLQAYRTNDWFKKAVRVALEQIKEDR